MQSWRNAMPAGSVLEKDYVICDLHFEEENVLRDFVTKMPDGTECRFKRDRVQLRKGAVPKFVYPPIFQEDTKFVPPGIQPFHPRLDENILKESDFRILLSPDIQFNYSLFLHLDLHERKGSKLIRLSKGGKRQ
ncbi:uncharacterized protein LOC117172796 isoform X2 [Belonocnema kinseyi]|uniref:uncharacterized protein LOC117172796 isoform X2 n=1 Tax=Belonocnema kinseyi TaxID=2817044 RepID=UPI00143DB62A|nr:uncharacterized protein LOC117172796 isoform X2 [Belonocnema kinseyi]